MMKRYHPNSWNIYCFQCSDGDNWPEDTSKTLQIAEKLRDSSQLFGYCEINPGDRDSGWYDDAQLSKVYQKLVGKKLKTVGITCKADIWPAFRALFGNKRQRRRIISSY